MSGDGDDDTTGHMIVWPIERLARRMRAREHGQDLNPAPREALRFLARVARNLEATAYRRLREMETKRNGGRVSNEPGAPRRTREAARTTRTDEKQAEKPTTPTNGQPAF